MRRWGIIFLGILLLSVLWGCDKVADPKDSSSDSGSISQDSEEFGAGTVLPDFKAVDLENNYVTNEIFGKSELTMINIWATYCGPCINEMPDLQRLHEDIQARNVQIIGIVADKKLPAAREIAAALEITYVNLLPDRSLTEHLISQFDYVPVTVFVDSEGRLLDTIISGSRDYSTYLKTIDEILARQSKSHT